MSFHYSVKSYDFHTYFKLDDPLEVQFATDFKAAIEHEFAQDLSDGKCRLFQTHMKSIGPHADGYGMFESDTRSPETFLKLLNFYQINHGNLSVLIHPRTDMSEVIDHTRHALWLGEKMPLKIELLEQE